MLRKKKKESPSSAKPASKSKLTKPVKNFLKAVSSDKKNGTKKSSSQSLVEKPKVSGLVKKSRALKSSPKTKARLAVGEPMITGSFKTMPRQGETQLVAFVRDPQCVFTYWEVTPERLEAVKKELKEEFKDSHMVLRLFSVGTDGERILVDEIRLEPNDMNHYVGLKQAGTYVLEIAQKTKSGRTIIYVQSNVISTASPSFSASENSGAPNVSSSEISEEMMNYFYEQGYDPDSFMATERISSAENYRRLKNKNRASFF